MATATELTSVTAVVAPVAGSAKPTRKKAEPKAAKAEPKKADPVTLIVKDNGEKVVHIALEPLRRYLLEDLDISDDIVQYQHLYRHDDPEIVKGMKDRASKYPIGHMLSFFNEEMHKVTPGRVRESEEIKSAYKTLYEILRAEKKLAEQAARQALEGGKLSFEQLIGAFKNGDFVVVTHDNNPVAMEITGSGLAMGFFGPFYRVTGKVYGWDGRQIVTGQHQFVVTPFRGERELKEIGIVPLKADVETTLAERGRKFLAFNRKPYYAAYTGVVTRRSWWGDQKFTSRGRVMVDIMAMHRTDANYDMWFAGIGPNNRRHHHHEQNEALGDNELTSRILACMIPYVYGFSFVSKQWGEMTIDELSDIEFRTDAYDRLVLEEDAKDMILGLVDTDFSESKDFVDGKGGGCIFLLSGPPGCGKTLTAEAVAEKLHRPLYMAGIGELGTNVAQLEKNLSRILETAASWNAVLLIDEADIFLAERNDLNVERNAMVGVFLRLLEYYPGILFLTSNLADKLDKAVYSRISLALQYENLDADARTVVWNNFFRLNGIEGVDAHVLASHEINGRQIKNCVRIAMTMAARHGRKPVTDDFLRVITRVREFKVG